MLAPADEAKQVSVLAMLHRFPAPRGGHAIEGSNFQWSGEWPEVDLVLESGETRRPLGVRVGYYPIGSHVDRTPVSWTSGGRAVFVGARSDSYAICFCSVEAPTGVLTAWNPPGRSPEDLFYVAWGASPVADRAAAKLLDKAGRRVQVWVLDFVSGRERLIYDEPLEPGAYEVGTSALAWDSSGNLYFDTLLTAGTVGGKSGPAAVPPQIMRWAPDAPVPQPVAAGVGPVASANGRWIAWGRKVLDVTTRHIRDAPIAADAQARIMAIVPDREQGFFWLGGGYAAHVTMADGRPKLLGQAEGFRGGAVVTFGPDPAVWAWNYDYARSRPVIAPVTLQHGDR